MSSEDRPVENGDFVLAHVTLSDAETGSVYMTTVEEEARKAGIFSPDDLYEPMLIIVGEQRLFPKAEQALIGAKVGGEVVVELEPSEAFGDYDPNKEKILPISRLQKAGIKDVSVGDVIRIGDERGTVRSITGGRVRIDFNHPLAGRRIKVWMKVEGILRDQTERLRALTARYFDVPISRVTAKVDGDRAEIELPPAAYTKRDAFVRKVRLLSAVMRHMPELARVRFIEEFEVPKEKQPEEERAEEAREAEAQTS
ncbi:MAG TPA: peptidylprolyl isomerase [Candidatus Korarchaeota archaeon]|nr:peptidylprolyl isomerase [Candidatus Korarchaeota archaeon]